MTKVQHQRMSEKQPGQEKVNQRARNYITKEQGSSDTKGNGTALKEKENKLYSPIGQGNPFNGQRMPSGYNKGKGQGKTVANRDTSPDTVV